MKFGDKRAKKMFEEKVYIMRQKNVFKFRNKQKETGRSTQIDMYDIKNHIRHKYLSYKT